MRHQHEPDLGMEIEDQMAASGRHGLVPRQGLAGAHPERRVGLSGGVEKRVGAWAAVAPTPKAELFERARHALGSEGGAVSRAELDRAAWGTLQRLSKRRWTAAFWRDRAALWLREDWRRTIGIATGTALAVGLIVYLARRT
jgi:hypothetical protein